MADHSFGSASGASKGNRVATVNLVELLTQQAGQSVVPVRLVTGMYEITWNSVTWYAAGQVLQIAPIRESMSTEAQGARIRLSGVPASLRSLALDATYSYPGRPVTIYTAILAATTAGYSVDGTPDVAFAGYIDRMTIRDSAGVTDGSSDIEITCESKYRRLRRPNERRMSDEQQRFLYPSVYGGNPDTGLRHLTRMKEDTSIIWGRR